MKPDKTKFLYLICAEWRKLHTKRVAGTAWNLIIFQYFFNVSQLMNLIWLDLDSELSKRILIEFLCTKFYLVSRRSPHWSRESSYMKWVCQFHTSDPRTISTLLSTKMSILQQQANFSSSYLNKIQLHNPLCIIEFWWQ